jgi:hypothetical protein
MRTCDTGLTCSNADAGAGGTPTCR